MQCRRFGKGAMSQSEILEKLFAVIRSRQADRPEGSYVVQLLDGGIESIGAKVLEEAQEVVDAARGGESRPLSEEVADLLFHLWVLMADAGIAPEAVYAVLNDRFGLGGLVEKASRE